MDLFALLQGIPACNQHAFSFFTPTTMALSWDCSQSSNNFYILWFLHVCRFVFMYDFVFSASVNRSLAESKKQTLQQLLTGGVKWQMPWDLFRQIYPKLTLKWTVLVIHQSAQSSNPLLLSYLDSLFCHPSLLEFYQPETSPFVSFSHSWFFLPILSTCSLPSIHPLISHKMHRFLQPQPPLLIPSQTSSIGLLLESIRGRLVTRCCIVFFLLPGKHKHICFGHTADWWLVSGVCCWFSG